MCSNLWLIFTLWLFPDWGKMERKKKNLQTNILIMMSLEWHRNGIGMSMSIPDIHGNVSSKYVNKYILSLMKSNSKEKKKPSSSHPSYLHPSLLLYPSIYLCLCVCSYIDILICMHIYACTHKYTHMHAICIYRAKH